MTNRNEQRLDLRTTPGHIGRGPDADEVISGAEDTKTDYGHREDAFRQSELSGFWKRSEYRNCNQGPHYKFRPLDMNVYFGGPTWLRARADSNPRSIA